MLPRNFLTSDKSSALGKNAGSSQRLSRSDSPNSLSTSNQKSEHSRIFLGETSKPKRVANNCWVGDFVARPLRKVSLSAGNDGSRLPIAFVDT